MNRDLFGNDRLGDYSTSPDHRGVVTSIEAAEAIASEAPTWRDRVLAYIDSCGTYGATADEVSAALTCHFRTTQPRISELRKMGKVMDSGKRRKNDSGIGAIVWVAVRNLRLAA